MTEPKKKRWNPAENMRKVAMLLALAGAAMLWGAGRLNFVTVTVADDKSGDSIEDLVGSVWDPAGTPLALAILASLVLSFALQPLGRRIMGGFVTALGLVASYRSMLLLTTDVDLERARQLLTTGVATQRKSDPVTIAEWAQVVSGQVHLGPVLLAAAGSACAIIGGVLLLMRPGGASTGHSRYERPEARRAGAEEDLEANPGSSQVLWDAMDAGVDPTDEDLQGRDFSGPQGKR